MKVEIVPEPSDDERAAILAALADEAREQVAVPAPAPQELQIEGEDSVRP
jgi:hypothetical protein